MTEPLERIDQLSPAQKLALWGCFVTATRYGGVYEHEPQGKGATWCALTREQAQHYVFELDADQVRLSGDAFGTDMDCERWWFHHAHLVGLGRSPDAAVLNLINKLEAINTP